MLMFEVCTSLGATPRSLTVSINARIASLLAERASRAVEACVTTPTLMSATSGSAETLPVPVTEMVRDSIANGLSMFKSMPPIDPARPLI